MYRETSRGSARAPGVAILLTPTGALSFPFVDWLRQEYGQTGDAMTQLWSMDPLFPLSGFFVGLLVGQTGMGGGALMTPILVLLFGVHPATAVGTDLLYPRRPSRWARWSTA